LVASLSDSSIRRKPAGNGELQQIGSGLPAGEVTAWRQDKTGLIRIATLLSAKPEGLNKRLQTWYRRDDAAPWMLIDDRGIDEDVFEGVAVTENPDEVLVLSRNGGDRIGVWGFDVVHRKLLEQVASRPDADVTLIENAEGQDGVAQVRTEGLVRHTIWFDDRMKRLQAAVDATLADHVNFLESSGSQRILVESRSDTDPGQLYVLDANTMSMQPVGARRPSIDPAKMHPMRMLWYTAPDGRPIPAYLTLPGKPNKPVPLVVLVHGGPQVRDHWEWNEEVQILAGNGYGVFQPQFRGSAGFGKLHQEAGYGQWGLAMQDDITAGVKWLIDQHIADPDRICIVGSSYGGYAALWGLEKTPELYKCGVSVAGVTDIEREFTTDSDVAKSETASALARQRVGDPALMKVAFDEVSPVKHADRIRVPVLLVHGLLDQRVPIVQGQMMRDALEARQASVAWLQFNNEAHGISHTNNLFHYYHDTLNLLSAAIGRGERATAAASAP
jgi:dipeptidyl aminopeptidase/acylaminoacyl peptidase